jgi:hypothetical protein
MYTTNLTRAAVAIIAGIIAGGTLVVLWSFWGVTDVQYLRDYWHRDAKVVFTYAALVWASGLLIFALVPWAILHRKGIRRWWVAIALGAALAFIVALGLLTDGFGMFSFSGTISAADSGGPTKVDGRLTRHGWAEAFKTALICGALGGVVGLVVWRTAYRWVPSAARQH